MRQWLINAFSAEPFMGNPACIVEPLDRWPDESLMQSVARENRQPMTAFLRRTPDAGVFDLRWFNPRNEVSACGHATLAAGHLLFTELGSPTPSLAFNTRAGVLTVTRGQVGYEMFFPKDPAERIAEPAGLREALGIAPLEVWRGRFVIAIVEDEGSVLNLKPDMPRLRAVEGGTFGPGHVAVAARSTGKDVDVVDRCFIPQVESPEDLATGTAHCTLGALYSSKLGREMIRFRQAPPDRGSFITTKLRPTGVVLCGSAVTVLASQWCFGD